MLYPAVAPVFLVVIPEGDLRFFLPGYTHRGIAIVATNPGTSVDLVDIKDIEEQRTRAVTRRR